MVSIRDLYAAVKDTLEEDIRQREAFIFDNGYGASSSLRACDTPHGRCGWRPSIDLFDNRAYTGASAGPKTDEDPHATLYCRQ